MILHNSVIPTQQLQNPETAPAWASTQVSSPRAPMWDADLPFTTVCPTTLFWQHWQDTLPLHVTWFFVCKAGCCDISSTTLFTRAISGDRSPASLTRFPSPCHHLAPARFPPPAFFSHMSLSAPALLDIFQFLEHHSMTPCALQMLFLPQVSSWKLC